MKAIYYIVAAAIALFVSVLQVAWNSWVIMCIWDWYNLSFFFPFVLNFYTTAGILMIVYIIRQKPYKKHKEEELLAETAPLWCPFLVGASFLSIAWLLLKIF